MQQETGLTAVAHAIQLAVAPVFLLSGVGAMLAVLTNRLSRIIDRSRTLEHRLDSAPADPATAVHSELRALSRRASLVSHAIASCTIAALLVCALIATLFLGAFFNRNPSLLVGLLFVAAMVALFVGLLSFLREIFVATLNLRIGPR